jgi:hypothetical protein
MPQRIHDDIDLGAMIGRVEGKVDLLISKVDRHDIRVSSMEKHLWWGRGALAVACAAILPKVRMVLGI